MRLLAISCLAGGFGLAVGCASANVDPSGTIDAPRVDAPDVDAPPDIPTGPVAATLQQTVDTTIASGNSVACGDPVDGVPTDANSWFRVFSPAEANVTNDFLVNQVTFAVEVSAGSPTVTILVGTYSGAITDSPLVVAKISAPLAMTTQVITPTTTGISVPVSLTATIPAGMLAIVEIRAPMLANPNTFYLGTTISGESHSGYLQAATCGITAPQTPASINNPLARSIIVLSGTH